MYINKTDASRFISPRAVQAAVEVPVPEEDHEDDLMEDERDGDSPDPHDDAVISGSITLLYSIYRMERWIHWQLSSKSFHFI